MLFKSYAPHPLYSIWGKPRGKASLMKKLKLLLFGILGILILSNGILAVHAKQANKIQALEKAVMTDKEILSLIETLLQPTFGIDDAVAIFGEIEEDRMPNTIRLTPTDNRYSEVILEYLELEGAPEGDRFLAGISLRFAKPVPMSFALFAERYGEPSKGPRLHRDQPTPYRFQLDGYPHPGHLLLFVNESGEPIERFVTMVKLLRHPT